MAYYENTIIAKQDLAQKELSEIKLSITTYKARLKSGEIEEWGR